METDYTAQDFTVEIDAADYIERFRDAERIAGYCRQCGNYGRSWACPPFDSPVLDELRKYNRVLLIATRITPSQTGIPISRAPEFFFAERQRLEKKLLEMEKELGGRAYTFAGSCLYCPEGTCTRTEGKPCRHPELVRPSLEAVGFDLGKTLSELFGMQLLWSSDGTIPAYLTLICGFFYNK